MLTLEIFRLLSFASRYDFKSYFNLVIIVYDSTGFILQFPVELPTAWFDVKNPTDFWGCRFVNWEWLKVGWSVLGWLSFDFELDVDHHIHVAELVEPKEAKIVQLLIWQEAILASLLHNSYELVFRCKLRVNIPLDLPESCLLIVGSHCDGLIGVVELRDRISEVVEIKEHLDKIGIEFVRFDVVQQWLITLWLEVHEEWPAMVHENQSLEVPQAYGLWHF